MTRKLVEYKFSAWQMWLLLLYLPDCAYNKIVGWCIYTGGGFEWEDKTIRNTFSPLNDIRSSSMCTWELPAKEIYYTVLAHFIIPFSNRNCIFLKCRKANAIWNFFYYSVCCSCCWFLHEWNGFLPYTDVFIPWYFWDCFYIISVVVVVRIKHGRNTTRHFVSWYT